MVIEEKKFKTKKLIKIQGVPKKMKDILNIHIKSEEIFSQKFAGQSLPYL